jgi:hypothetical protein
VLERGVNPSEEYARRVADALELNQRRVFSHFGERCCGCGVGRIDKVLHIMTRWDPYYLSNTGMLIEFGCDRGCERLWCNEECTVARPISGVGIPLGPWVGQPRSAAILAACMAAAA